MAEKSEFIITARDQTREAFRSVEQGLGRLNSAMGGLMAPLAALTSAAGFGALIKGQIDLGDQLSKTSQKLGIAVEDLSAYQYAAKLSDVSNEQLTAGLSRLAKAMQEAAANPASQTAQAFRALGVSVIDAAGNLRPLNLVLEEVSRRFEETRDGTNKTAMAVQLFGRSGTDLVPLLNSLSGLSDEARRTGNIVSTGFAKSAERSNDELTRMNSSLQMFLATSESGGGILDGLVTGMKALQFVGLGAAQGFEELGTSLGAYLAATNAAVHGNFREAKAVLQDLDFQLGAIQKKGEAARAALFAMTETQTQQAAALEMASISRVGIGDKEAEQTIKYQTELQKQLEALNLSIAPKQEALAMKLAMDQATIDEGYQLGLLSEQAYYEQSAMLQADYEAKRTQIAQTEQRKRVIAEAQWMQQVASLQQQGFMGQLQGAGIMLGQMSNLMLSHKKKEFELGKKAAIGQALVNTFLGVSQALSYGFPLGLVFAAIQLAVGMANVARIRSQKFGGGGGATPTFNANPGTGLPEPITNTAAEPIAPTLPQQAVASTPTQVTMVVESDSGMVSTAWMQDKFAPVFNQVIADGGIPKVVFTG